ncbi:MAG TPA: universal stress protein [Nakamurella sp.]
MTIVVGYLPAKGGRACLDLASLLARSGSSEPVAVVTVVPASWSTPSMAKVDAEFAAWAQEEGDKALATAGEYLAAKWPDVEASFHRAEGRSVPSALTETAEQLAADLLVLGSSTDGRVGQVIVGSTAEPLLHSSEIPVAIAPRGYRAPSASKIGRLTCSYSGIDDDVDLVTATAQLSVRMGCPLRIATFGVRGRTMYPPRVGLHAEDLVLAQWKTQVQSDQRGCLEQLTTLGLTTELTTTAVATGSRWDEAMDDLEWESGEVLVVGSSRVGRLARVFLGSKAIKIVRYSPVPVVVVPAAIAAEIADDAIADADAGDVDAGDVEPAGEARR